MHGDGEKDGSADSVSGYWTLQPRARSNDEMESDPTGNQMNVRLRVARIIRCPAVPSAKGLALGQYLTTSSETNLALGIRGVSRNRSALERIPRSFVNRD